jgi:queuosine precursor transporter
MSELSRRERIFLMLVGLFLLALVVANVFAASKLIQVDLGFHVIVVAAGILPYPVTFLVTDLISELYGRERANFTVLVGFAMSIGLLLFIEVGKLTPAFDPVQQEAFASFFSSNARAVSASMLAYLLAQLVDVRLFHWWKRRTNGRHLWLRNNGSTVGSQLLDTVIVTTVLFWGTSPAFMNGQTMGMAEITPIIRDGFVFKAMVALLDTPLLYLCVRLLSPHTGLTSSDGAGREVPTPG